jgi:hypothetical protein
MSRRGLPESSAIRKWAEDRRAASAAEARELAASEITPAQSLETALSLLAFYATLNGWPPPDDPIDERDDLEVWARFARLRAGLHP